VLHGNNKSVGELTMAIEAGVGRIVVDSFDELDRLESPARRRRLAPRC
jgi:diaminopimelate decarboxylase